MHLLCRVKITNRSKPISYFTAVTTWLSLICFPDQIMSLQLCSYFHKIKFHSTENNFKTLMANVKWYEQWSIETKKRTNLSFSLVSDTLLLSTLQSTDSITHVATTTTILRPFFRDHQGEPVPEENFWTSRCKGRLTEAETSTIPLVATPSGLTSAHLHQPPFYSPNALPAAQPTVSKHWRQQSNVVNS